MVTTCGCRGACGESDGIRLNASHDHRQVATRRDVEPAQIVEPISRDGDRPRHGSVPRGTPRRTPVALQQIPARPEPVESSVHPPARQTRIRTPAPFRPEEDLNRGGRRSLVRCRLPAPGPNRHPGLRAAPSLVDRRDPHRVLGTGLETAEVRRTRRRRQIDRIDPRNDRPSGPELHPITAHRGTTVVDRRRPRDGQPPFTNLHPQIRRLQRNTHLPHNRRNNNNRQQRPRNERDSKQGDGLSSRLHSEVTDSWWSQKPTRRVRAAPSPTQSSISLAIAMSINSMIVLTARLLVASTIATAERVLPECLPSTSAAA